MRLNRNTLHESGKRPGHVLQLNRGFLMPFQLKLQGSSSEKTVCNRHTGGMMSKLTCVEIINAVTGVPRFFCSGEAVL